MATKKMSLKLLLDNKGKRVLFAEAPKEFVDFLFHIFSLPLGTLIELIGSKQMVGCLGNLKDSIQSFNLTYLQEGVDKNDIFNPKTAFSGNKFLLTNDSPSVDEAGASKAIYVCANLKSPCYNCNNSTRQKCQSNATLYANTKCPGCSGSMNVQMNAIIPDAEVATMKKNKKNVGFVKEVVTYMVMDDLVVKPMSTISSITLISKFGVKDLSQLEEKVVSFGEEEGLKLLKASLRTVQVLSTVFMH